jgi:hypothetical protein
VCWHLCAADLGAEVGLVALAVDAVGLLALGGVAGDDVVAGLNGRHAGTYTLHDSTSLEIRRHEQDIT